MRRRILIDARMYGLENTGIGRYLTKLLDNLKTLGAEFEYIVFLKEKYYEILTFPDNWKKVKVDINHYSLGEQIILPFLINKYAPDMVHFPHINIPFFYNGKYVVTMHDLTMHTQGLKASRLPLPLYLIKRPALLLITKKAVKNAQMIITPSLSVATDICNTYAILGDKVVAIYEGGPKPYNSQSTYRGELYVLSNFGLVNIDYFLYVGNAFPHKNLEMAISAVVDLNQVKNVKVKLLIAGTKDYFVKRLENYVEKAGASEYVKIVGFVKDEDLPVLYKNAVGFVYPSLSEGFGLQGLEAITFGTTLLCSNIPVFKEVYGTHAFYFDPRKLESVSGTMFSVVNLNKSQKNEYLRKALDFIKKYSWNEMAQQTLGVYRKVLESKPQ